MLDGQPPGGKINAVPFQAQHLAAAETIQGGDLHKGIDRVVTDRIVVAAGSKPLVPPIPGIDNKKVIEVYDVHKQNALPAGENVVICGGGLSAIDTALEHAPEEAAASSPSLRCVIKSVQM